jgi:hypothetical protein
MNPGAIYYNAYYPGPIGLPENSVFQVSIEGHDTLLYLVRHVRPVTVTDFGNDFTYVLDGERRHLALKRAIPSLDPDLITLDVYCFPWNMTASPPCYARQGGYHVRRVQAVASAVHP